MSTRQAIRSGKLWLVRVFPLLIAVLLIACSWTLYSWNALRRQPETVYSIEPLYVVSHNLSLDYRIDMMDSLLFPDGAKLDSTISRIPMRLIDSATLTIVNRISSFPGMLEEGLYSIDMLLRAGDLWSKHYAVLHNIPIERGQVVIAEVFDIPLQEVFKDVAAIQKEVGVSPATGRYDVEIRFHISAKPEQGEMTDTTAVFAFGLTSGGLILEAPKELSQSRHIAADASVEKPNVRRLFGQSIGVRDLANLYLYTAIVLLLAVTGLLLWKRRLGPAVKSASRYLSRFVEVQAVDTAQVTARIRMKKIDELVRLADEVESMLFRYSGDAQIPGIAGWETSYGAELLFTIHDSNFYYVYRSTRDEA